MDNLNPAGQLWKQVAGANNLPAFHTAISEPPCLNKTFTGPQCLLKPSKEKKNNQCFALKEYTFVSVNKYTSASKNKDIGSFFYPNMSTKEKQTYIPLFIFHRYYLYSGLLQGML